MGWRAGFRADVRAQLSGLTPAAPCTDGIPPSLAHACGYSSRSSRNCLPTFPRIRGNGASPARHCAREKGNALGSRASACARDAENGWCMRGRFFAVFRVRTKTGQSDRARNGRRGNRRESDIARPGSEHRGKAARQRIRAPLPAAGARGESADHRHEPTQAVTARRATQPARPASPSASTHRPARRSQATRHRRERRRPPPSFTPASRRRARRPPASALRAPASPRQWRRRGRDGDDCRNPTDGSPA
ncbi:Uncharacterised protein [Burkholderia pseudomallei]|nr:Uncharacterised protein [Burkholderia pseudomallei]CAJ2959087.1 Uncharacterised protein [Burkholderia pseudomallei]CAJ4116547.1 Uncharacterised protein [Burkholderia pseudomallei]CAJ4246580.1 Uncharacterised protein [Burkholderia pseudomallei]CAJ4718500.1 Uncharacterised protein [Burkholderia pseudomallei]